MKKTEFKNKMKALLVLFILPLVNGDRVVTTSSGPVKGISLAPKKVEAFLGIPYAEPPVGTLRFSKPLPKSPWTEIYDADKLPPTCMQYYIGKLYFSPDDKMSEDCLHLNLWVPEGGSGLKPIMLFIHGGGLMFGSSNTKVYDGATLSEHGDVIVATINYRVGTLGFFSGFIEEAPGSMGMYDQIMAMQWVKDNAQNFGGDPDNIVLFGESSGAVSVSLHMISPLSRNLFKRAILQSGSAFNPIFSKESRLMAMSQIIARLLGCAEEDVSLQKSPKVIIDCMKALPPERFREVDAILMKNSAFLIPRFGDAFLPENAIDSFMEGNFKDTELLTGITRDEGPFILMLQMLDKFIFFQKGQHIDFNETMAWQLLQKFPQMDDDAEIKILVQSYFDRVKKEPNYTYLRATADILGDYMITCSAIFQADCHSSRANPVYFYRFSYRPDSTPLAEWMGVAHFDEVQYVFGNPMHQEFTEYEKEFSRDIMDMWVAFAKTGNPNIPLGVKWPQYTVHDPKYLEIGKKDRVGMKPDENRCELLRDLFRAVIDEDTIRRLKTVS